MRLGNCSGLFTQDPVPTGKVAASSGNWQYLYFRQVLSCDRQACLLVGTALKGHG